jgi:hypothetical protein
MENFMYLLLLLLKIYEILKIIPKNFFETL